MVRYDGRLYEMREIILWLDKSEGVYRYSATLVDIDTHCSLRVRLEMVEPVEQGERSV